MEVTKATLCTTNPQQSPVQDMWRGFLKPCLHIVDLSADMRVRCELQFTEKGFTETMC